MQQSSFQQEGCATLIETISIFGTSIVPHVPENFNDFFAGTGGITKGSFNLLYFLL